MRQETRVIGKCDTIHSRVCQTAALPEEERREVLRVVAVEKEWTPTDPNFRQFVDSRNNHQLSTARSLHHTA